MTHGRWYAALQPQMLMATLIKLRPPNLGGCLVACHTTSCRGKSACGGYPRLHIFPRTKSVRLLKVPLRSAGAQHHLLDAEPVCTLGGR